MGSHALKVGIRLELFVTLRKQKNKEMKRLKRALFSRDADATASLEAWSKAAWRAAKQLRDAIGSMPANGAPVCESIRRQVTESAGITTVFREHYKQRFPTGVRRVRRGQL
jgi:hypothetical protein